MWRVSRIYRRIPGFRPLKRAWRSRGFGIHSPFAFRFVTRVLREDGEYYAYRELRRIAHSGARFADLSLLFRIICCFSPSEVGVFGGLSVQARKAIALADSRVRIVDMPAVGLTPQMLYVAGGSDREAVIEAVGRVFGKEGVVICHEVPSDMLAELKALLTSGMTFSNATSTILISRHDLSRQDFEVNF